MDWPQAIETLLRERGNLLSPAIDVNGVTSRPFQGYFLRGAVPCIMVYTKLKISHREANECQTSLLNKSFY